MNLLTNNWIFPIQQHLNDIPEFMRMTQTVYIVSAFFSVQVSK